MGLYYIGGYFQPQKVLNNTNWLRHVRINGSNIVVGGATKQVFVGNWTEIVQGCQFIRLCAYDPRHLSYTILHYLATTCKNSLRVQLKLCISCNRRF